MTADRRIAIVAEENILNRIYMVNRFPPDFMFEMNIKELENWRTQFASSKEDKQGLRYAPFCFSEQGVTMLSCILNSERAISVNIQVIRVFSKMRGALMMNKDIFLRLEQLETLLIQALRPLYNSFEQESGPATAGL
jgi:phage regulator Rha-like protein